MIIVWRSGPIRGSQLYEKSKRIESGDAGDGSTEKGDVERNMWVMAKRMSHRSGYVSRLMGKRRKG